MEDNLLLKIAALSSIIGIGLLYYSTLHLEANDVLISELSENYLGEFVRASGVVISVKNYESTAFLLIENNGKIGVFVAKEIIPEGLEVGDKVLVSGIVKEYKGGLELVPLRRGDIEILK